MSAITGAPRQPAPGLAALRRVRNGDAVRAFEHAFAGFVGAKYAIALTNGTATLHTALAALGIGPGDKVAVPPLTMSATTLAVLHAGALPAFVDVNERTWLMQRTERWPLGIHVCLYGLIAPEAWMIDDAAQTLRQHSGCAFTSYSFQASKILATGEGGMLVTNDEHLATQAREFSSLGYRMDAAQPRIDPETIKGASATRHHRIGYNYRMADAVAAVGLRQLDRAGSLLKTRRDAADIYRDVVERHAFLTPQHIPDGWAHDFWTYAVACDGTVTAGMIADGIVAQGGERPYAAWRLAYDEPALKHLVPARGVCRVAEDLQPRLLQFQTNNIDDAWRNAQALLRAIRRMTTTPTRRAGA